MDIITEAEYMEIHPSVLDIGQAGEYYFYSNLVGVNEELNRQAEEYEVNHIKKRNEIIAKAIKDGELSEKVNINNSLLAISSIKNKSVFIT